MHAWRKSTIPIYTNPIHTLILWSKGDNFSWNILLSFLASQEQKIGLYQDCGSLSIHIGDLNEWHLSFRCWSVVFIDDIFIGWSLHHYSSEFVLGFFVDRIPWQTYSSVVGIHVFILGFWNVDHLFSHTQNPSDPKLRGVWCISRASPVQWVEAAVGKESSTDGNKNCSTQGSFQKARAFGEMFGIWNHWSSVIFGKYTNTNGCWINY